MARRYASTGAQDCSSSLITILGVTSATTTRPAIVQLLVGTTGTPADNALRYLLQRYTAAGTSTSVTPQALDPADPAALASAGENHTAEPTYTSAAKLLDIALHQKNTLLWVPNPGAEIVMPATANNGVGLQVVHASYTGECRATFHHEE